MPAINKRKLLASAQKHVQKGALDKALKDYQTILEADPRDSNVRLKLGDLQLRRNETEDAIGAYLKVADQFMRDGFDAKAVALYKQVTKIDPKRVDVQIPLADLYQRLGLASEAMVALQTAADAYHRDGKKREALDLLRRMASLDPSNTTSRLKVADLLRQEGLHEEAVAEYDAAATELERQGDWENRIAVLQRILELAPDRIETLAVLSRELVARNQAARAEPLARRLVELDGANPEAHELLAEILGGLGRAEQAAEAYRKAADAYHQRGDEDHARAILQRHVQTEGFGRSTDPEIDGPTLDFGAANVDIESPFGEEGIGGEPLETGDTSLGGMEPLPPLETEPPAPEDAPAEAADEAPAEAAPEEDPGADVDIDQLLAETTVYLRYGKHERAAESLRAVLRREPEHPLALERLGEALMATGEQGEAVASWVRAAEIAAAAGDGDRLASLRARIEEIDADAASALPRAAAGESPPESAKPARRAQETVLFSTGGDDAEPLPPSGSREAAAPASEATDADAFDPSQLEEAGDDIEIEIEDDDLEGPDDASDAASDASAGDEPEAAEESAEPADPGAIEIDVDGEGDAESLEDLERAVEEMSSELAAASEDAVEDETPPALEPAAAPGTEEAPAAAGDPAASPSELSTTTSQRIADDLEEASFYFEQGLYDEAESIYRRVLEIAPSHPGALLRLGEIAAGRGQDPDSSAGPHAAAAPDPDSAPATEQGTSDVAEPDAVEPPSELDLTSPDLDGLGDGEGDEAPAPVEADEASESTEPESFEPAAAAPEPAEPEPVPEPAVEREPVERAAEPAAAPVEESEAAAPEPSELEQTEPEVTQPEGEEEPGFDLAAELSEVLGEDEDAESGAATDEDGFEAIFRDFKKGVSQQLDEGDAETHFDLGIAYREMGLCEDAIGEFRFALDSPARRLDALHMMGLCALDVGRPADAVAHFEQALASPDVPAEREAPLRFGLGRAYDAQGDAERALAALRRVVELDPEFQDAAERIAALERGAPAEPTADESETYESFDDLLSDGDVEDVDQDDEGGAQEAFESFEDVMADVADDGEESAAAEPVPVVEEPPAEPEPVPEPAAVAEPEPAPVEERAPVAEQQPEVEPPAEPETRSPEAEAEEPPQDKQPGTGRRRRKVSFL